MTQLERAVFDAALALIDATHESALSFRGMPSRDAVKQMAARAIAAGRRLDEAVDAYRRAS